jgi:tetratricopeptide (TPR) repeat protein
MKGKPIKKTKKSKMKGTDEDAKEGNKHFIIGDNLRHKAFYEDAIDEFQKALHLQEPVLGTNSTVVAKTHYSLGLAYRATKVFAQAMHHLKAAASIYENQGEATTNGEFDTELKNIKLNLARTHHSYGFMLQRNSSYDDSIVEHRRALAIRETVLGRTHLETARSHYVMGCALSDRGDFDEALGELRRALRVRLMVFAKDHLDVREVTENIGTILFAKGTLGPEAIAEYKTVVLRSLDHENEGDICCRKQEFEEGMVCYRKGISLEEQCLGDLHPTTCDLYLRMAVSNIFEKHS